MRACSLILCAVLAAAPALAADKGGRHHPAHHHGIARLEVILEGGTLQIALDSPADNLLGFEHAPRTDAQRKTVTRVEQQLQQPAQLFTPAEAADCRHQAPRIEMKLPAPDSRETHSEIAAEWRWECARPQALGHVDVGLFKVFPRLRELRVQVATAKGQKAVVLKPGAIRLRVGS
jgi:hypothetical protein